jgi:hypothetical protein
MLYIYFGWERLFEALIWKWRNQEGAEELDIVY